MSLPLPSDSAAHVGTVIGGTVFFFTYLPYMYITFSYHQRTYTQKILSCLFSNVAMAMGVRFISLFEAEGKIHLSQTLFRLPTCFAMDKAALHFQIHIIAMFISFHVLSIYITLHYITL